MADTDAKIEDKNNTCQGDTPCNAQKRLIKVAEQLFAEKGFDATSVRDLTAAADCNLAAVNYHFGSKEGLYTEMFVQKLRQMRKSRLDAIEKAMTDENVTLEKLLLAFSKSFMAPLAEERDSNIFINLFAREMCEHRLEKGLFMKELAGPTLEAMTIALQKIYPSLDGEAIQLSVFSLITQLLQIFHIRRMLEGQVVSFEIDTMLEHIIKFSAAGIRSYVKVDRDE